MSEMLHHGIITCPVYQWYSDTNTEVYKTCWRFGIVRSPTTKHQGLDMVSKAETSQPQSTSFSHYAAYTGYEQPTPDHRQLIACTNGKIVFVKYDNQTGGNQFGNMIVILSEPIGDYRYLILYGHMAKIEDHIKQKVAVSIGERVGWYGTTDDRNLLKPASGYFSSLHHLHLQITPVPINQVPTNEENWYSPGFYGRIFANNIDPYPTIRQIKNYTESIRSAISSRTPETILTNLNTAFKTIDDKIGTIFDNKTSQFYILLYYLLNSEYSRETTKFLFMDTSSTCTEENIVNCIFTELNINTNYRNKYYDKNNQFTSQQIPDLNKGEKNINTVKTYINNPFIQYATLHNVHYVITKNNDDPFSSTIKNIENINNKNEYETTMNKLVSNKMLIYKNSACMADLRGQLAIGFPCLVISDTNSFLFTNITNKGEFEYISVDTDNSTLSANYHKELETNISLSSRFQLMIIAPGSTDYPISINSNSRIGSCSSTTTEKPSSIKNTDVSNIPSTVWSTNVAPQMKPTNLLPQLANKITHTTDKKRIRFDIPFSIARTDPGAIAALGSRVSEITSDGKYYFTRIQGKGPLLESIDFTNTTSVSAQSILTTLNKLPPDYDQGDPEQYLYDDQIVTIAKASGIPASLIKAIIRVESDFKFYAISSAKARGLGQFMSSTAVGYFNNSKWPYIHAYKKALNISSFAQFWDIHVSKENQNEGQKYTPIAISLIAAYLYDLLNKYGGVIWKTAANYNGGGGDVANGFLTAESYLYMAPIIYYFQKYSGTEAYIIKM